MKDYTSENIRNVVLVGHGGSGKTILADAMMLNAGATTRIGSIVDGSTISDYHADEIERQISINSTVLAAEFKGAKLNLIDTPGFTDFLGDVVSSLRVVDTALLVLKSVEGVEVGSEQMWKYARDEGKAVFIVVNKMDNEHADFDRVYEEAKSRFGNDLILAQFPVNKGPGFNAAIDIIRKKLLTFSTDGSGKYTESEVPDEYKERVEAEHEAMLEKVAESTEDLLNAFFENGTLNDDELAEGLRAAILTRKIFPVFCMAGESNIGVSRLMEFIINYCPNPLANGAVVGHKSGSDEKVEIPADPKGRPVAFIFKTLSELHVGELSLFRVYSGTIKAGDDLMNQTRGKTERLNQLYTMRGKERSEVNQLDVGDIGAVVKLKDTHTNNTLSPKNFPVEIEPIVFPEPLITGAVHPKAKGDEEKIGSGLHTLHEEDPAFIVKVDTETKETVILGQGEIHLDIMIKRLKQRFGVDVDLRAPRIPYRETIRKSSDVSYKHKKQTGGAGQYAEVYIRLEPTKRGEGYSFESEIVGGAISGRFIPAVDKGIHEQMAKGVIAGYTMVDMKVTLYDGSQHTVDSNEMAFKVAGQHAFRKAIADASPMMLEPIYTIEVIVPDEFMGDVMGDISSHRGKIQGMDAEGPFQVIRAKVPLSELYQYATRLRSITQGRGIYKRSFSNYEQVPAEEQEKIIAAYIASKEEDS